MNYKVYQIVFTKEERDLRRELQAATKQRSCLTKDFFIDEIQLADNNMIREDWVQKAFKLNLYTHAFNFTNIANMEEIFNLTTYDKYQSELEAKGEILGEICHRLQIGDVIEDENGNYFIVTAREFDTLYGAEDIQFVTLSSEPTTKYVLAS